MFGLMFGSLSFKLMIGALIIGIVYVVAGQMLDRIGEGAALERELEIRDKVIEESNRREKIMAEIERDTEKRLRESVGMLREQREEFEAEVLLREEEIRKMREEGREDEIPECPVICRNPLLR